MSIPTFHQADHLKRAWGGLPAALQFLPLAARLTTLQDDATRILRNNAELAERLKATETQMAQDNASVAEQLKALTQMARDNASAVEQLKESHEQMTGLLAKVSEESLRPQTPLPPPHPTPAMPKRKPVAPSQARIQPQSPFEAPTPRTVNSPDPS